MSHIKVSTARIGPSRLTTEATIEKPAAPLDARSVVALEWSQHWLQRHASLRVPPAVLIRRALQVLADRLSNLEPDEFAREGHLMRDAARGKGSAVSLTEARARMERHVESSRGPMSPGPQPMAHWHDMLHSIEERRETRQMLDRLEAIMAEQFPEAA
jgi:hypothetical protein